METNLQNFCGKSLCRACMKNVDDPGITFINNSDLINKYSTCTSIEVDFEDGLPLNLCQGCCSSLNDYYDFRKMCLESNQKMLSLEVSKKADLSETAIDESLNIEGCKIALEEVYISEYVVDWTQTKSDDGKSSVQYEQSEKSCFSDLANESREALEEEEDEEEMKDTKKKGLRKKNRAKTKENAEKEVQIKCPKCPKKFLKSLRLQGHLRQHDGLIPFVCDICKKEFDKWDTFRVHKRIQHKESRVSCTINDCNKSFKTSQTLQSHIKLIHQGIKRKRCVCKQCGITFGSRATLIDHMSTHSGIYPYTCNKCQKKFVKKSKLDEHLLRHSGVKNFICEICGAKKTTVKELRTHMLIHKPEKNHKCEHCLHAFNTLFHLKRHIDVVHNKLKKYPCVYCDLSFGKLDTLKHHTMRHTGDKPEVCSICDKRFIQRAALLMHMRTHKKI